MKSDIGLAQEHPKLGLIPSRSAQRRIVPLLRWAGGKRQLLEYLLAHLPTDVQERKYFEPFLGAGSMFFALTPKRAVLSDANEHLIQTYRQIAEDPELIGDELEIHGKRSCEKYYYHIRDCYNSGSYSVEQAARFIFLNKTCFNGIFRVNRKGDFNVPYGWKEPPCLPTPNQLRDVSKALGGAELLACSFEDALSKCKRGDFVYLDPPYPPLNGTTYFTHYTADRFDELQQRNLAVLVHELDRKRVKLMISNADTPLIRSLYRGLNIRGVPVIRYVTCKAKKHLARELVITNYS